MAASLNHIHAFQEVREHVSSLRERIAGWIEEILSVEPGHVQKNQSQLSYQDTSQVSGKVMS